MLGRGAWVLSLLAAATGLCGCWSDDFSSDISLIGVELTQDGGLRATAMDCLDGTVESIRLVDGSALDDPPAPAVWAVAATRENDGPVVEIGVPFSFTVGGEPLGLGTETPLAELTVDRSYTLIVATSRHQFWLEFRPADVPRNGVLLAREVTVDPEEFSDRLSGLC